MIPAPAFLDITDAWGRPALLRVDAVALVEGARDPGDRFGDLWAQHPPVAYRKLTLLSGAVFYVTDDSARTLMARLTG